MITGFLCDTLPALIRESGTMAVLTRLWMWLKARIALGQSGVCFTLLGRVWRWVKGLFQRSLLGGLLREREDGGRLYENSLFCRLVDGFFAGLTRLGGKVIGLLTFGTGDSLFIGWARTLLSKVGLWDYPTLCGVVLAAMFLCPGQYWSNAYGLLMAVLLIGVLFVRMSMGLCPSLRLRDLSLPFVAFAFATVLGVVGSSSVREGLRVFTFFLTALLLAVALIYAIRDEISLKRILGAIYVALVLTGLYGFVQRVLGVEVDASLTDLTLNAGMPGRVFSTFENPNNYAEFLVMMIPLGVVYCAMIRDTGKRALGLLGLILPLGALLMTYSRSGWVSFALMVVAFLFLYNKKLLPWVALVALLAVPLLPESIFNRILTIGSTQDSSNTYRLYIWDAALDMVGDFGLAGLGLGPGNFTPVYLQYCHAEAVNAFHSHMLYLELWLEMGILGLGAYLLYYLGTIRKAVISLKRASKPVALTLMAGASALLGMSFISAVEYIWFYPRVMFTFFVTMGILTAAIHLSRQKQWN